MVRGKLVFLAIVYFVLVTQAQDPATKDDHNLITCVDPPIQEVLLYRGTVSASGKLWQTVQKTLTIPISGIGKNIITCIRVVDLMNNGHGGYPYISEGGLDARYVTLKFVSQLSYGLNFQVEVWGQK